MAFRVLCEFTGHAWSKSLCVSVALRTDLWASTSLWFGLTQRRGYFLFFIFKKPTSPRSVRSRSGRMGWSPPWWTSPGDNQTSSFWICHLAIRTIGASSTTHVESLQFCPLAIDCSPSPALERRLANHCLAWASFDQGLRTIQLCSIFSNAFQFQTDFVDFKSVVKSVAVPWATSNYDTCYPDQFSSFSILDM